MTGIDTRGYVLLPGLINAHDHLEFNLYPRLGCGPYPNCKAWANDIFAPDREPIKRHQSVPKRLRLLWGGIKNLLSGVTCVCHHNRREDPTLDDEFPVRVVKRFGWAHSLDFDPDVGKRFRATPKSWPFIVHLGEGTDGHAAEEIFKLHEMGALDERTVLVHGVALDNEGVALVRKCGGSLIWCPSSNLFVLGRTLAAGVLRSGIPIALGSDSGLTADGDLRDEMRVARRSVDCQAVYRMVTAAPRRMLRIHGRWARDVAWYRDLGLSKAETLVDGGPPDAVMVGGRIQLASENFVERLPAAL
ncbi:MAG TPA: amidohydrolase family protein, partial [Bryobacteraceae bacterium]